MAGSFGKFPFDSLGCAYGLKRVSANIGAASNQTSIPWNSGRLKHYFTKALQRMPAQREGWLTEVCAGDEALLREVTRLVASHELPTIDASKVATSAQPNDEAVRLQPGHRLGPYEIVSFLAAGGMGAVYRASESLSY
jgi:hypothetical protein